MNDDAEKPYVLTLLPDFLAFGMGLALAYYLKWETKDLVWSLWLGSLVLGYLTILSVIFAGAVVGIRALRQKEFEKKKSLPVILLGTVAGLFLLGFFSIHFCGFHAVHSVFLHQFFPLAGVPSEGFGQAFMNPPLLWFYAFKHLIPPYGLFLIPALIAERNHVFLPLIKAFKASEVSPVNLFPPAKEDGAKHPMENLMADPYKNVIRMHLLIFFFAFCHFMKVDTFLVYAVVYSVYFFPWSTLRSFRRPKLG
jgi:hypothetical protein